MTVNRDTGITEGTVFQNDLGDVTQTLNDADGLPTSIDQRNVLGANLKKHSWTTAMTVNRDTGITEGTVFQNDLGDVTQTENDQDGMPLRIDQSNVLGAQGKRHSLSTTLVINRDTGITEASVFVNDLGDISETTNDQNGLPTYSRTQDTYGVPAGLVKETVIIANQDTGMTERTESTDALHEGPVTTLMDENGLAYWSHGVDRYGATAGREKTTTITTNQNTGMTDMTHTSDALHDGPVITLMDQDGLATRSQGRDRYGATDGRMKETEILVDRYTGMTRETSTRDNLHSEPTRTWMDENGMATRSHSREMYGSTQGLEKTTQIKLRPTGMTEQTLTQDGLHAGPVETRMDENGLAVWSHGVDIFGARNGVEKTTEITTRPDIGTAERTVTRDGLHTAEGVTTLLDENGLAYSSEGTDLLGPNYGRHKTTVITTRENIGTTQMTSTYDGLREGPMVTYMDDDGHAFLSEGTDRYGVRGGRHKTTAITVNKQTGVTTQTVTRDGLHTAAGVTTSYNDHGMAVHSSGTDLKGPHDGRFKETSLTPDPATGLTVESLTYDGLHTGAVRTVMDGNGMAVQSWATNKYGPPSGRCVRTQMTPDPDTGLTAQTYSETASSQSGGVVISSSTTTNDPTLGTPVSATSVSTFGSFKQKRTDYTVDPDTGLVRRSLITDGGGTTDNEHGEFGVTRSTRTNLLGAIKTVVTTNDQINNNTGMVVSSLSVDRKGETRSHFDANGLMTDSRRTNAGATFAATESTTVQLWNDYTGSPERSVSSTYASTGMLQGTTTKYFDADGFMERTHHVDRWGDATTTSYTNNRETGLPTYSSGTGPTGTTSTHYEANGLALTATFTASVGLNTTTEYYYDGSSLDLRSTKSTDERGNVSVASFNAAGEMTQSFSKTGTSTYDLVTNRVVSSSGPGGTTSYEYSGKWLNKTVNNGPDGTTTSWYDHRYNGAANKVQSSDGTVTYGNTYNSRGFVTYRTESNGSEGGYSRFNNYGDQQFTHWSGSIPAEDYGGGVKFLGGSWKSDTNYYYKNSRGDLDYWKTDTSWSGTMWYSEIHHYEFVCDATDPVTGNCISGHNKKVIDRHEHTEPVGGGDSKTDHPKWEPLSDAWVVAHLNGTQGLPSGGGGYGTQGEGEGEEPRDATQAGYHAGQKGVILTQIEQYTAQQIRASYQPIVEAMDLALADFARSLDLNDLLKVTTYLGKDANQIKRELAQASDKAGYLFALADEAYYYYSATHLTSEKLNRTKIQNAILLTGRAASMASLLDWLSFFGTNANRSTIKTILENAVAEMTEQKTAGTWDTAASAVWLNGLRTSLAQALQTIARTQAGLSLSLAALENWVGELVGDETEFETMAKVMNVEIPEVPEPAEAAAAGVTLGGGLAIPAAVGGDASGKGRLLPTVQPTPGVQIAAPAEVTDLTAAAVKRKDDKTEPVEEPNVKVAAAVENAVAAAAEKDPDALLATDPLKALPPLRLDEWEAYPGDKELDAKGRIKRLTTPRFGTVNFTYFFNRVTVESVEAAVADEAKKTDPAKTSGKNRYLYKGGWLREGSLAAKGVMLTLRLEMVSVGGTKKIQGLEVTGTNQQTEEKRIASYNEQLQVTGLRVIKGDYMYDVPVADGSAVVMDGSKLSEVGAGLRSVKAIAGAPDAMVGASEPATNAETGDWREMRTALLEAAEKNPLTVLPPLRLKDLQAQKGTRQKDDQGRLVRNLLPDLSRVELDYKQGAEVVATLVGPKGQDECRSVYLHGYLHEGFLPALDMHLYVNLSFGSSRTNQEPPVKTVSVTMEKKTEGKKIYKYNADLKLTGVLAKEGTRFVQQEAETSEEKERDDTAEELAEDKEKDQRLIGDKVEEIKKPDPVLIQP